ncbi:MAG: cytochrome C biogenesis protein [Coriobacteriaceae bacterium]|nr:cytochrome C biogenesis protein [Coriobacteriaceae bacterium]
MQGGIGYLAAFAAGVVSFLSPCVLPLLPGYLSFITGVAPAELEGSGGGRRVVLPALMFVAGFSAVFIALGASASVLGSLLAAYRDVLARVAGVLVIAMGLFMLGIVKVPWLYGEARADLSRTRSFGRAAALVMGMAFAFGWTPCVGPVLASILALAGSTGDVGRGALLLATYSAGLGVPFIATALFLGRMRGAMRWLTRHSVVINRVAGTVLIALGASIVTGMLGRFAGWLYRMAPFLQFG